MIFEICAFAQTENKAVEILQADKLKRGKTKNHQRLTGNVGLLYGDTKLYCDSAEINQITNDFEAWGRVYINQKDSIKAWGDHLFYNGATEIGELQGNSKLINENSELTTNTIFFDQKQNKAYYLSDGNIKLDQTNIQSKKGYFFTKSKYLILKDSIIINHPDYKILADTLKYSTASKTSYFLGPTNIYLGKDKIYCEKGFYNSSDSIAQFEKNAVINQKETTLKADSIYYDKKTGISNCYYNVELIDSINKINIAGNKGFFNQKLNYSYVTEQTLFTQFMEKDTLFLNADTLKATEDTLKRKSFFAFRNVKMFKSDMQGVCDSLTYSFKDSLISMYYQPILWNGENQITGDSIQLLSYDNKLHRMFINKNSFIISKTDSLNTFFDQIKGKNMVGFFKEGKLSKVDVNGNGQTIYYAKEDDGSYTGANKAECSNISITLKNNKIHKIYFLEAPIATFFPMNQFPDSESKLKDFNWFEDKRPKSKSDIIK